MKLQSLSGFIVAAFVSLLAISLNILLTLKFSNEHIGIRVGATDFLIPLAVMLFIYSVYKYKALPELIVRRGWIMLLLMTLWMGVSLLNGYYYIGEMTTWPLLNKFAGWFILMSYFVAGVYIGSQKSRLSPHFFRALFITSWLICLYQVIIHWFFSHGYFHEYSYVARHYRMEGLYQNPNAFGIFLSALFIFHLYALRRNILFYRVVLYLASALTLLCIFYSYSRSAWLGLILALIVMLIMDVRIVKNLLIVLVLTALMNFVAFSDQTKVYNSKFIEYIYFDVQKLAVRLTTVFDKAEASRNSLEQAVSEKTILFDANESAATTTSVKPPVVKKARPNQLSVKRLTAVDRVKSDGLATRLEILKRSISYWQERPLMGIGLGGHLWNSKQEGIPADALTIHNSLNWLLVETGIVGVLIFCTFIVLCLHALFKLRKQEDGYLSAQSMLAVIVLIIGASAATEVIYQRYFWLFLGLFLVREAGKQTSERELTNGST